MLDGSESDTELIWRISITDFLVLTHVSFVAAAYNGVFMSKTSNFRIVAEGLGALVPLPDLSARWIDSLRFFPTVHKTRFDLVHACVAFRGEQKVFWSCVYLGDPIFLCCWRTVEVISWQANV